MKENFNYSSRNDKEHLILRESRGPLGTCGTLWDRSRNYSGFMCNVPIYKIAYAR
jgi:hypothetical protein